MVLLNFKNSFDSKGKKLSFQAENSTSGILIICYIPRKYEIFMSGPCPMCTTAAATGGVVASTIYDRFNLNFIPKPVFIVGGALLAYTVSSGLMTYGGFSIYKYFTGQNSCHEESAATQNQKIALNEIIPFHISKNPDSDFVLNSMEKLSDAPKIAGNPSEGNFIVAHKDGSKIFAKGGLNYIIGSEKSDSFYFSLCSTKIEDKKTSVIHNFQDSFDKIFLFCSKHKVNSQDLHVHINTEQHFTVLAIDDGEKNTAITVLGEHPELLSDVVLGEAF